MHVPCMIKVYRGHLQFMVMRINTQFEWPGLAIHNEVESRDRGRGCPCTTARRRNVAVMRRQALALLMLRRVQQRVGAHVPSPIDCLSICVPAC